MFLPRILAVPALACLVSFTTATSITFDFHTLTRASPTTTTYDISADSAYEAATGGVVVGSAVALNASDYIIAKACQAQNWTIAPKSATAMQLHFASIQLPPGDALVVVAENNVEVKVVPAANGGETLSDALRTPTATLQYRPSANCTASKADFTLDSLIVGQKTVTKEASCGNITTKSTTCLANATDPTLQAMYKSSQSVLRSRRRQGKNYIVCTAWLWGNAGHLITNNHCFNNQSMVDATQFDFGFAATSCANQCDALTCKAKQTIKGNESVKFIKTDPTLDITLLQIQGDTAPQINSDFGYLRIGFVAPKVGDQIYIPQHPKGAGRMIALTDDDSDSSIATIKTVDAVLKTNGKKLSGLLGYSVDTEHGSSGSPVIRRDTNYVIGLHRANSDSCTNVATPTKNLQEFLTLDQDNAGIAQ